jgi:hypothetical protein
MYPLLAGGLVGPQKKFPSFSKNIYLDWVSVLKLYFKAYLMANFSFESKLK